MREVKLVVLLIIWTGICLAGKVVPMPGLYRPQAIVIDGGQLFITEFPQVLIYSLTHLKLIKKFGKAGEGPGEFAREIHLLVSPNHPEYIIVNSRMKVSYFSRDGKFVKEIRSRSGSSASIYKPLGKNYAAYGLLHGDTAYNTIDLYDTDLKKIKQVIKWERIFQRGRYFDPTQNDWYAGEFSIYQNKIFFLLRKNGDIKVFDHLGNKLFSFNYDYERIPVTSEDKKEIIKFFRNHPEYGTVYETRLKPVMKFPDVYSAARVLTVTDDKIYVLTYKRKEGKTEFIIFDIEGNFLKKSMVPFKNENIRQHYPFTINNGLLYQLVENIDDEQWELHIHPVD